MVHDDGSSSLTTDVDNYNASSSCAHATVAAMVPMGTHQVDGSVTTDSSSDDTRSTASSDREDDVVSSSSPADSVGSSVELRVIGELPQALRAAVESAEAKLKRSTLDVAAARDLLRRCLDRLHEAAAEMTAITSSSSQRASAGVS